MTDSAMLVPNETTKHPATTTSGHEISYNYISLCCGWVLVDLQAGFIRKVLPEMGGIFPFEDWPPLA
jgi:hypothetical protein